MRDAIAVLRDVYAYITEDLDGDPRNALLRELSAMIETPQDIPQAGILLTATLHAGGGFSVADQYGRAVLGVTHVSLVKDQAGQNHLQVTL